MESISSPLYRNAAGNWEIDGTVESWRALAYQLFSRDTLDEIWKHAEEVRRAEEYEESFERSRRPTLTEEITKIIKELRSWQGKSLAFTGLLLGGALLGDYYGQEFVLNILLIVTALILCGNVFVVLIIHFLKKFGDMTDSFA